jgi:alpha-L-fucosidase
MIRARRSHSHVKVLAAFLAGASLLAGTARSQTRYEPNWESLDTRPTPQWYLDAKFGIFIHWGVYSVPAWGAHQQYAEWYWNNIANKKPDNPWWQFHKRVYGEGFEYQEFAPQFKAELFDPDRWADLFYRSGAKYVVPTSKHHEGFSIWPSVHANAAWGRPWNSVDVGPKRDLLGELATAVRKKPGMHMGFYYSLYEWFNPLWLKNKSAYVTEHMHPQFKDVVKRYAPDIIFGDGEWDLTSAEWKSPELLGWLFNESPCKDTVVVNDRWGKECRHHHGTYYTTEYGAGMKDASHPWEESRGMAYSYGYNRAERIEDYKTTQEFVLTLVDLVTRGGNFLLDIGPCADGTIPPVMEERLLQIGDWLRVNGEAIYGTRHAGRDCQWSEGKRPGQAYGEFREDYKLMKQIGARSKDGQAVKQVFFTRKENTLYAITPYWPVHELILRNIKTGGRTQASLLGVRGTLPIEVHASTVTVRVPELTVETVPCQHAYTFKITEAELMSD